MRKVLFAAAAVVAHIHQPAIAEQAPFYVYRGAGCTGRDAMAPFVKALGRTPNGVVDFADKSNWGNMLSSTGWITWCWSSTPYTLAYSVPMLTDEGGTLADGAAGKFDNYFKQLGQIIVKNGYPHAYLRVGWEMNGGWYKWAAAQDPKNFILYYRRIVHALRSTPGQHFKIVWNPTLGWQQLQTEQAYPGDGYVDVIAADVYDQSWRPEDANPETRWKNLVEQSYGLNWLAQFAKQHKKPIALPEWGTGTRPDGHGFGNDPVFVSNMSKWISDHNVAFHGYWDYNAGDYNADFEQNPKAAAAVRTAFSARVAGAVATNGAK